MDHTDLKLLKLLMNDGRMPWNELAKELKLSAPAAADRVRRLEEQGVIRGYAAQVEPEAVACAVAAFVEVSLERPEHRANFLQKVKKMVQVQECHHTAGDHDYLLKIRCSGTRELEHLISEDLKSLRGILRTRTTIVLSSVKESSAISLEHLGGITV